MKIMESLLSGFGDYPLNSCQIFVQYPLNLSNMTEQDENISRNCANPFTEHCPGCILPLLCKT